MDRRWKNCRKRISSINKSLINNREGIGTSAIMMAALVMGVMFFKKWLCDICYIDVYALYSSEKEIFIIPFTTFAILFFVKDDFCQNTVIRYGSVRRLWLATAAKIGIISLYLTILITVMAGLCGKIFSYCDFNWNQAESYFYRYTDGKLLEGVFYPLFLFVFVASTFFAIFIYGLGVYLLFWITGSYVPGILIVIVLCTLNAGEGFFNQYCSADFSMWLEPINWTYQIVIPGIMAIFIILSGYVLVKNREFGVERKIIKWRRKK